MLKTWNISPGYMLKKHRKLMENPPKTHVISSTKAERLDVALQSPSAGVSRLGRWRDTVTRSSPTVRRDTVRKST